MSDAPRVARGDTRSSGRRLRHVFRGMRTNPVTWALVGLLRLWHWMPRIDTMRCRFYPTCAEYAITALQRFGLLRGGWLAVRRVGRCHPWNPGGVDHVPDRAPRHAHAHPATAKVR